MKKNDFHWWCLTTNNNNRKNIIEKEFDRLNIDVEFYINVNGGLYNLLGQQISAIKTNYYQNYYNQGYRNVYGNVLSCILGFYYIFKQSYIRNYDHIMVMEDDIKFLLNDMQFDDLLSKIPEDYDVIKFVHSLTKTIDNKVTYGDYYNYPLYSIHNEFPFEEKFYITSNVWNAYSRKAIIEYLNIIDHQICIADRVLLTNKELKFYLAKNQLVEYNLYQSTLCN